MRRAIVIAAPLFLALGACETGGPTRENSDTTETLPSPEPEPAFTTPCAGTGYSRDITAAGLPVREAPSANGRVLGRLYTITQLPDPSDAQYGLGNEPSYHRPSFRIIDLRGDWIRIEGADPVTDREGVRKANFTGRGWIPLAMVGYEVSGPERPGRTDYAYAAPDFASRVTDELGTLNILHVPDEPIMLGCRGSWIELRYRKRLPEAENAPPPRDPYGDGPWTTGWIKVEPYVTYQTQ